MSHLVLKDEEKFLSHFEIIKSLLQNEQLGANNNKNWRKGSENYLQINGLKSSSIEFGL